MQPPNIGDLDGETCIGPTGVVHLEVICIELGITLRVYDIGRPISEDCDYRTIHNQQIETEKREMRRSDDIFGKACLLCRHRDATTHNTHLPHSGR